MTDGRARYFVQSLEKGLDVISSFNSDHPNQTLSEVARNTGLTRASARRFLLTLVDLGYVEQQGDRFALRPTVLGIGRSYLSMLTLPDVAEPHMRVLASAVGEAVGLTVLDGLDAVVVVQSAPGRAAENFVAVGERFPALSSASGRCLLAQLPDQEVVRRTEGLSVPRLTNATRSDLASVLEEIRKARRDGYSIVEQEFREGVRSIAMPVYAGPNQHPSAVVVSARSRRMTTDDLIRSALPKLQLMAHAIEAEITRTISRRERGKNPALG